MPDGAGDGDILDRLYTPDNAMVAMNWLYENMGTLRSDLVCAVGAATYVANHAAKRFAHADDSVQMTGDDAEFLAMAQAVCESQGFQFTTAVSEGAALNPLIVSILFQVAKNLLKEWLRNYPE